MMLASKAKTPALIALALLALLAVPVLTGFSFVDLLFRTIMLGLLAYSWNLMASAGLISLGHAAFWGLGSYTCILLSNTFGLPFWITIFPAMAVGAAVGALLAYVTGHIRGIYFAICTLALSEGLKVVGLMVPDLTGGGEGLYLKTPLFPGARILLLTAAIGLFATSVVAWIISTSRMQYALRAMRNNENAAMMLGVNPVTFRIRTIAISGAMTSFGGGLSVYHTGFIDPRIAFDIYYTLLSQLAPILGGLYSNAGPLVGAIATIILTDGTRAIFGNFNGLSLFVFGVTLIISVIYLPMGVVGIWNRLVGGRSELRRPIQHE